MTYFEIGDPERDDPIEGMGALFWTVMMVLFVVVFVFGFLVGSCARGG